MGLANWYDEHVVPRIIRCACGAPAIAALRENLVPRARGSVFELGCGGGLNQSLYDADRVTAFAGIDPSAKGLDYARAEAARRGWTADIREGVGEAIPFEGNSFDTVVCTYTLCSVTDASRTLSELLRILKPGGKLLFLEHGAANDLGVAKWQRRIEPVWKRLAGGCHLTRPVTESVRAAGFAVEPLGARFLPRTPRFAGWMEWGEGIKDA